MKSKNILPLLLLATPLVAGIQLNPLFSDHAVLQRDTEVPVWGTADPGAEILVRIEDQAQRATAGADGKWKVTLSPIPAGGPYTLSVSDGGSKVMVSDILFGEVWLCSGQSNMEWPLIAKNQPPLINADSEIAKANYPLLRHFNVGRSVAFSPQSSMVGEWAVCSPDTAPDFSAVAFFFGKDLLESLDVPIGLVNSSWGGTRAEAWTSSDAISEFDAFSEELEWVRSVADNPKLFEEKVEQAFVEWYRENDPGSRGDAWSDPDLDTSEWETMTLPVAWEDAGHPDFDGVVWFRKDFDLPAEVIGKDLRVQLGVVDYFDTVWINGSFVGSEATNSVLRNYAVPASLLRPTGNVIAVRVLDGGNVGGILDTKTPIGLLREGESIPSVDLSGEWRCRFSANLKETAPIPASRNSNQHVVTVLYNAMIAPLLPYRIRGVIWYQGESNASRARQYRELFPAMIADWRDKWNLGDLPFLYVQIAPYNGQPPEIREAQLLTLARSPNTAMAVITDNGNAENIHPLNKEPVGQRLALAAKALVYGEDIEYSGPIFVQMEVDGNEATLHFDHTAEGLVASGGVLRGFTVAGEDGTFHPAEAVIEGDTVVVSSPEVEVPVAVRYGWANVPDVNLFNTAGLPASPFRTDVD